MKHARFAAILVLLWGLGTDSAFARDLRYDLLQAKEYDRAIAECTRRIGSGEGDRRDTAYSHWVRGYAYLKKGERDHAIADYGRAIELDPTPDRCFERAELYKSMSHYEKAVADYLKAAELYEVPHDDRGERYNAQMARVSASVAAEHGKWDKWIAVLLLCGIPGYLVFRYLRSSRNPSDGRRVKAAWLVLLLSVTLIPFLLVQGLSLFGWPLRFISIFQLVLLVGGVALGVFGVIMLFLLLTGVKRKLFKPAGSLVPTVPMGDGNTSEETPGAAQSEEWRYCPQCGAATVQMKDVRFCHKCGAPIAGAGAMEAASGGKGGGS
jgi:hypothetical protein